MRLSRRASRHELRTDCSCQVTVSVIVPCYNYGRFLTQCVESALTQEGVLVDVLIIDDGSTDDSSVVAESLADMDSRVKVIKHQRNRGHIATYNEGLSLASGKYCMLLSADDLLTPGALTRATCLLEANPEVGLVYGKVIPFGGTMLPIPRTEPTGWSIWAGPNWVHILCQLVTNVLASPEVVLRTDIQRKIGGYSSDLPHSGDMEMWMRAAAVSCIGRVDSADQAYYREHAESMSRSKYYTIPLKDLRERRAAFEAAFHGLVGNIPHATRLRSLAMRSLANVAIDIATAKQHRLSIEDPEGVEPAVAFAVETSPEITRSIRYKMINARASGNGIVSRGIAQRIDRFIVRCWNAYRRRRNNLLLRNIVGT